MSLSPFIWEATGWRNSTALVESGHGSIRRWCLKFGPGYSRSIRRKQGRLGDTWHGDEIFLKINRRQVYLWRAVDQGGEVLDILVTNRRNRRKLLERLEPARGIEPPTYALRMRRSTVELRRLS